MNFFSIKNKLQRLRQPFWGNLTSYIGNIFVIIIGGLWWARYILISAFVFYCIYTMRQNAKNDPVYQETLRQRELYGNKTDVCFYAREALKKILKNPSSVKFLDDEVCERNRVGIGKLVKKSNFDPEKAWSVVGSFDAQNSFGAIIRSRYGAVVVYLGNDQYKTIYVSELDQ